jgi:membrane fusion protein (multidrug efflux system)
MSEQSPKTRSSIPKGRRNTAKIVIIIVSLVILAVIVIIPKRNRNVPPAEVPPVNVTVMTVTEESELIDTFALPAVVEPNRIVSVSAEVGGRIENIPLKKGNLVHAGDLLIRLNEDLLLPEFEGAEAQFKRDKIEYERVANLVKENVSPPRDLDNATTQLAISKARLAEVRARLERTRVLAPSAGLLNNLLVEEGEYVQVGTPLAELVDTHTVKVVVEVPERDIIYFDIGQKAEVFTDVKGREKSFTGIITFISKLADQQTRSTRMEITLENKEGLLYSGQIVRARLTRQILRDVIFIPLLAVIPMEESKAVYVVNSSQAQRREVELGIIKGDRIQVKQGLAPGDQLIIAGHRFVAPGQNVNVTGENK